MDGLAMIVPFAVAILFGLWFILSGKGARQRQVDVPIRVDQPAGKCQACGMREGCGHGSG